ncbi:MAG: DUF11 domain-containing protein [Clostridiales bacterium]|nr:DUF11 domain-containing protein [Clostridiales bacterium]
MIPILRPGESEVVPVHLNALNVATGGSGADCTITAVYQYSADGETNMQPGTASGFVAVYVTDKPQAPGPATPTPVPTPVPERAADLVMTSPASYITTKPGESVNIGIVMQNNHKTNIASSLVLTTAMAVDFKTEFVRKSPTVIRPGEKDTFYFIVTPSANCKPGYYDVPFNYQYQGPDSKTYKGTGTVKIQVEESPVSQPSLVIDGFGTSADVINAGDSFEVFANITNMGSGVAESVEVTASGFTTQTISLSGSDTAILQPIGIGLSSKATFNLSANETMAAGAYPIKFTVTYKNSAGEEKTFESQYYINVAYEGGAAKRAQLDTYTFEMTKGPLEVGDTITVNYVFVNNGSAPAENIRVTARNPEGVLVPTSDNIQLVDELIEDDAYQMIFTFTPTEAAKSQTYMIEIETKYDTGRKNADGSVETLTFVKNSGAYVSNPEEEEEENRAGTAPRARLTVTDMTGPAESLGIGETGVIQMTIRNSGNRAATNIKVDGSATGEALAGLEHSSVAVQTISELRAGESQTIEFSYTPGPSAKSKTYTIPYAIDYENGLFTTDERRVTESFSAYGSISVLGADDDGAAANVIVSAFKSPEGSYDVGESGSFTLTLVNNGDKAAKNIKVSAQPEAGIVPSLTGNIQSVTILEPGAEYQMTFAFMPASSAKTQAYSVGFTVEYENGRQTSDGQNERMTFTQYGSFSASVAGTIDDGRRASLSLQSIVNPEGIIGPDGRGIFELTIENTGQKAASNIRVSVANLPGGLTYASSSARTINGIAAGASATVSFELKPNASAVTQTYTPEFTITYENGGLAENGRHETESFSAYGSMEVNIPPTAGAKLVVSRLSAPTGEYNVGSVGTFSLTVTNSGDKPASNVKLTAQIPEGLVPSSPSVLTETGLAPGDSAEFSFSVMPSSQARTQFYAIGFQVDYENGLAGADGRPETASFSQYGSMDVKTDIGDDGTSANLSISGLESPEGSFAIGKSGDIRLTLTNNGDKAATNIRISAAPPAGIVPSSPSIQSINTLEPGASVALTFSFMPSSDARTQTYAVGFDVEYDTGRSLTDGQKERSKFSQYGSIAANVPAESSDGTKSVPKIILSEYKIISDNEENPLIVQAGHEFDVYLRIKNTHPTKTVKNIIVSLSVPDSATATGTTATNNVFTPVNASNSFYIDEIEPGGELEKTIRMFCLNNAVGKNYTMLAKFNYEDDDGNAHTATEEFGITVSQIDELDIEAIPFPEMMYVGSEHYLFFYFRNTGFVTLRNLKIIAEGEGFEWNNANLLVGHFTSGSSDYFDASLTAIEPGEHTIKITATYSLDTGEEIELVEEGVVNVMDMGGDPSMAGYNGMGGGRVVSMSGGGGVVIVDGGMGGDMMGGGSGFDPMTGEPIDGMGGGTESGFVGWVKGVFNYFNANVWPWVVTGAVIAAGVSVVLVRRIRRRRAFSLED